MRRIVDSDPVLGLLSANRIAYFIALAAGIHYELTAVHATLQSLRKGGHHAQPRLLGNKHFIRPNKVQAQHTIVAETEKARSGLCLSCVSAALLRYTLNLLAFPGSHVSFGKDSARSWKVLAQIESNKGAKRSLFREEILLEKDV